MVERKNAFLGYKKKKLKNSKNWHFSKEVNPWFWSKNGHFSNVFFLKTISQENVFYHSLEGKNAFLGFKKNTFKTSKNWHFSKGINPWFWSKNGLVFNFFVLGNIGQENGFYDILERKNAFLGYKKKKLKNSKNWHFSKGFWSNNGHFSNFFVFGTIGQENVFYHILERKNAFLAFKKKKLKNSKNWHFTHGFDVKMAIFPSFLF